MTERLTLEEYRKSMGLLEATDPKPTKRRDTRWRDELKRQIDQHPRIPLGGFLEEFKFHQDRRWRFDFAFIDHKLAVEVEGIVGGSEKSRHTTWTGYTADCIKYSEAAVLGWRLIRVTQEMIKSGMAIELIERALRV
jgi:very-short-patch-repair endonuclease